MKLSKFIPIGIAALAMLFASCEDKPKEEKDATAIALNPTTLTLDDANASAELMAVLTPSDATGAITWSSSDETLVTVVPSGERTAIVTGIGTGEATVTAKTSNGLTATCALTANVTVVVVEPMPNISNPGAGYTTIAIRVPEGTCNGVIMVGAGFGEGGADDWS
ncbi:MAG: Ig-like domain-containing protein, partial [Bacteroidales bacterium]|nr:Ig-like domain-containing protein [Bacteroidales bacterium]